MPAPRRPIAPLASLLLLVVSAVAVAHPGRRFEVRVVDGRLVAQGVNTLEFLPHGETAVRPYASIVHDHFTYYRINGRAVGSANLPGFDVPATLTALHGHELELCIVDVSSYRCSCLTRILPTACDA